MELGILQIPVTAAGHMSRVQVCDDLSSETVPF